MFVYVTDMRDLIGRQDLVTRYISDLETADRHRFDSMTDPNRRLQFLVGRALIRDICHQSPILSPAGQPTVRNGYISLAHSGPYVVLAVSDTPVGIDIEDTLKNKDFDALATRLGFTLGTDKRFSFYRSFTAFEARYKRGGKTLPDTLFYYLINTFIICISILNNNKKIEFIKTIPTVCKTPISLSESRGDL